MIGLGAGSESFYKVIQQIATQKLSMRTTKKFFDTVVGRQEKHPACKNWVVR